MKLKLKKSVALFEVAIVVLLVSLASVFLFRGYGVFIKVGKRNTDYIHLALLTDEKFWELQLQEKNREPIADLEGQGTFNSVFSWKFSFEDSEFSDLKKGRLTTHYEERKESLDTIMYFFIEGEEG